MKKYIALTFVLIFSFFLFGCAKKEEKPDDLKIIQDREYIIIGVKNDSPPFGFIDKKNRLVGLDIDIANEIAGHIFKEKSPANIKFVPVNAQNRIAKLNSGEVDILVATMSVNEKRKLIMNFSMPYFVASQKLMVRKTSKVPHLRYFNKNGRLAIILGTTGQKIARLISPNANLVGVKTYTEAYNLLVNKQVDAILGDDCILAGLKNENLKILNKAYSREYYAVAIRKSEESKELLNRVNAAIASVLDDKKINHITKKWILY